MDTNKEKLKEKKDLTNREFAEQDEVFKQACLNVGIEKPTQRQASKWRRKTGKAYKAKHGIL